MKEEQNLQYNYNPNNLKLDVQGVEYAQATEFTKLTSDKFHIGQVYSEVEFATILECKFCGSRQFEVGIADYYTAIKCTNCNWEAQIHEG